MSLSITTPQKMEKKKIEIVAFIKNPYKPSALCVGHGQNGTDPDQAPHNAASDLGLHGLLTERSI